MGRVLISLLTLAVVVALGVLVQDAGGQSAPPDGAQEQPPDTIEVEATGEAVIFDGDVVTAREEAIVWAKVHALEEAIGNRIDSQLITHDGLLLHSYVKMESGGFVRDCDVLRERTAGGLVEVDVKASILTGQKAEAAVLQDLVSNTSIIVDIPETSLGEPSSKRYVQDELRTRLTREEFRVLDLAQAQANRETTFAQLLVEKGPQAANRMRLYNLSNLVLKGRVECNERSILDETFYAGTDVNVDAVIPDTAVTPVAESLDQVKGWARNYELACRASQKKAAKAIVQPVMEGIRRYLKSQRRIVVIEVHKATSGSDYRRVEHFIEGLPWIEDFRTVSYDEAGGVATFEVQYKERSVYLANRFDRASAYHLVRFTDTSIVVSIKSDPPQRETDEAVD